MKIFSSEQTRRLDRFTIEEEPISSVNLMERASKAVVNWITKHFGNGKSVKIFCGPGNNGGDGLAVARLLGSKGFRVTTFIVHCEKYSDDFLVNLNRLKGYKSPYTIKTKGDLPDLFEGDLVIDALFGSGLSRPISGIYAEIVKNINLSGATVVAIDIASGLYCDSNNDDSVKISPDFTLTFQYPKLSLLLPQNQENVGEFFVLDIGLHNSFIAEEPSSNHYLDDDYVKKTLRERNKFSHKGTFGKALIIAGSYGSMGAAVLTVKACYRSGTGLVYAYLPKSGVDIMQIAVPEAIAVVDGHENEILTAPETERYDAVGIGPGISEGEKTFSILENLFQKASKPMVIDASALNVISGNKHLLKLIPAGSVLTPHPKEFERLKGKSENDYQRLELVKELAAEIEGYVVLKGAHTVIATPEGELYFNSTGNSGMATGGSGDVLTGIITGLLAQGYQPKEAALLGVYLHGFAGNAASKRTGKAPLLATDIIESVKDFYLEFELD